MSDSVDQGPVTGVAIVGMAGRFPGAANLRAYWRNLRDGIESITHFGPDHLAALGMSEQQAKDAGYVAARGTVDGPELFDASFFGYSPREATIMDPQQRLFLECAWEALESAGYDPKAYKGLIGVYGGATASSYMPLVYTDPNAVAQSDPLSIAIGNEIAFLTTRVSYKLDLRGPSCPVQTACSTSLVAVHLACQGLLNAECDLALAGGVSIRVPQESGYVYQPSGILSPDGHCRPFDSRAQGTLFSNGIGIVALRRLDDALADGDTILAVIRGSAINNDGSHKASFTAPAVGGQGEVIADALMNAGVEPETISYIEAHGTATALGDSIEMQALNRVFPTDTARQYCAIGSVKSNLGHLDAAAGIAGLIKTTMALQHRELPPSLHFERHNPDIDFANSAFRVNARLTPWKRRDGVPLRAGVSAFGFGGTNAHVVLEEAPQQESSGESRPWQLLTLSTESEAGLATATESLAAHLRDTPQQELADVAYTLKIGRRPFRHRRVVVCRDRDEAITALDGRESGVAFSGSVEGGERPVVFMFPGQGAQHVNMALDLYEQEPLFRESIDTCAELLRDSLGFDLREALYPEDPDDPQAADRLRRTRVAQPALFAIEYALAVLWMDWGVKPEACIGHSVGEFVAATLAGVMSLEDALRLVARRGELMEQMPEGVMLAVPLPEERVRRLLKPGLWLSVVNSPTMCVVSGGTEAVDALERTLTQDGVQAQRLHTSHAFHSGLMDAAVQPFVAAVSKVRLSAPQLPYLSNVTGGWITEAQACDPNYWGHQLRQAVRFSEGVSELLKRENRIYLEVGPGQTLSALVRQQLRGRAATSVFSSLRHVRQPGSDFQSALTALGRLWVSGVDVAWADFYRDEVRRRVPLPTYPFQRQRFWVSPRVKSAESGVRDDRPAGRIGSLDRWFYTPSWRRTQPAKRVASADSITWLICRDEYGLGDRVSALVRRSGNRVIVAEPAASFARMADDHFGISPTSAKDFQALVDQVAHDEGRLVVLHLWSIGPGADETSVERHFADVRERAFTSLLRLAQALGSSVTKAKSIEIALVTSGGYDVTGSEALDPGAAAALGLCRVIPQEYPEISCRSIDLGDIADASSDVIAARVIDDVLSGSRDRTVAFRGGHRWVLGFESATLPSAAAPAPVLRDRGTYVITGGLGDIGLHIAEYLARAVNARLVLTGRSGLPPAHEWDACLSQRASADPVVARIRRIRQIEAAGGQVLLCRADAANAVDMERALAEAEERFGSIHGVIHAAGLVMGDAFRPIAETDDDICRRQFAPKVDGLCVLDTLIRRRAAPPDFVMLVSSLSALLGGLRFAAYSSANAFMDAFAWWRHRTSGTRWLTVNWDSWRRAEDEGRVPMNPNDLVMSGAEGIEAVHRILSSDVDVQVAVSTGDLQARIDQWITMDRVREEEQAAASGPRHPRPNLQTEYVAPGDDLEERIATIWQDLLGIERVGVNDSFFELGGDSLLGVQVISRIKKQLAVTVSAVSLYEGPTVALLAGVIKATGMPAQLDQSRSRGDRRREERLRRQLQTAG